MTQRKDSAQPAWQHTISPTTYMVGDPEPLFTQVRPEPALAMTADAGRPHWLTQIPHPLLTRAVTSVVGKFSADGVNNNEQYLVGICAERGLFFANIFFQHKMIHRYTWARGNERSLIDYIAVDNRMGREVEHAKVVRGMFRGSDHFAVVVKVRMRERWEFTGR